MKNPDHAIAPGLDVSALVEFYTTKAEDAQDRVILVADNDVVEIPLIALVIFRLISGKAFLIRQTLLILKGHSGS